MNSSSKNHSIPIPKDSIGSSAPLSSRSTTQSTIWTEVGLALPDLNMSQTCQTGPNLSISGHV